jgi:hypothetical protein
MATPNDSRDPPMAEPGKQQAGADVGGMSRSAEPAGAPSPPSGAPASTGAPAGTSGAGDDDEEPWRHPPVAPRDEDPLKSLGRSVSETVTGPLDDKPAKPKA